MEDVVAAAEDAARTLERLGDKASLAAVLDIGGRHAFYCGRAREAVTILGRSLEISLELGNLHRAREAVMWSFGAMAFGPTPVREAYAFTRPCDTIRAALEWEKAPSLTRAQLAANSAGSRGARPLL
jgi:hypothetical protein